MARVRLDLPRQGGTCSSERLANADARGPSSLTGTVLSGCGAVCGGGAPCAERPGSGAGASHWGPHRLHPWPAAFRLAGRGDWDTPETLLCPARTASVSTLHLPAAFQLPAAALTRRRS